MKRKKQAIALFSKDQLQAGRDPDRIDHVAGVEPAQDFGDVAFHGLLVTPERQRDLLRSVWSWYLLPFVPGLLFLHVGFMQAQSASTARFIVLGGVAAAAMAGIHFLNRYAASRIQERIDRLRAEM